MHASRLNRRDRLDGSRQLAFQTALIVDLFGKLADAELLSFHQFKTDRTASRQSLRGQTQANIMDSAVVHEDGAARLAELVGHVHLFERGDDGAAVTLADVREQHFELALSEQGSGGDQQGDDRRDRDDQQHFLPVRQARQRLARAIQRIVRACRLCGLDSRCRHARDT